MADLLKFRVNFLGPCETCGGMRTTNNNDEHRFGRCAETKVRKIENRGDDVDASKKNGENHEK
jgi:hypothetical protein